MVRVRPMTSMIGRSTLASVIIMAVSVRLMLLAALAVPFSLAAPLPVIAAFGDSLSAGFGVDPGKSYPDDLQRLIDAAGYHYRVVNLGISGDTTTDGLERLPEALAIDPA